MAKVTRMKFMYFGHVTRGSALGAGFDDGEGEHTEKCSKEAVVKQHLGME